MNKLPFLLFLILSMFVGNASRADSLNVYPSGFYTLGKYSSGENSTSLAGYSTFAFNHKTFFTFGYDNLTIDYNSGNYKQRNYTVSFLQNLFPSYFKVSYSFIDGENSPKGSAASTDNTHLVSLEYYFFSNMFYYGIAGTYLKQSGSKDLSDLQITPRIEWVVSPLLYLSLKPNYTYVNDKRNLFSVSGYISWQAIENLYLKLGGFIGRRALYFDTDLLTIYNQNETQTKLYTFQLDYIAEKNLKVTAGYQFSNFSSYSIDYFYLGLRTAVKF
ncbi:MAG: hypothetical protein CVV24_04700 [Ignavibacteriae bacterium HGW-Ignavibacteriae-3]|nr:MAG: hypothetical protein CVV24_04700 [Ignavibacteriae bacterium HGW-Ignavibacteriae-3]